MKDESKDAIKSIVWVILSVIILLSAMTYRINHIDW